MARVKVGLALAGGGVRGAGHLGVVKALYENKIYPEIFTGTSAGSIVASLLAVGYSPDRALKEFESISSSMIDIAYGYMLKHTFHPLEVEGFVKGDVLESKLDSLFKGKNISKVYNPLGIVATDINMAKQVIFTNSRADLFDSTKINDSRAYYVHSPETKLSEIIRASSSMPPVFIPKHIGSYKLVDGGVTNNLPSDVAVALGAEKVLSIDLGSANEVNTNGIVDIAHECINIFMLREVYGNAKDFGHYMNPQIFDISALEVGKIQECFDRGYDYGKSQIEHIVKYLEG
jgi:NTE family protein